MGRACSGENSISFMAIASASDSLLVAQGLDRVLSGRAQRRVERADGAAEQADGEGDEEPTRLDVYGERGRVHDDGARGERQREAHQHAEEADDQSLLLDDPGHARARHAERLQDSYLSRPLGDGRVHGEEDDEQADDRGDAYHHVYEDVKRRHARGVKLRQVARVDDLVFGEGVVYARGDGVLLRGVCAGDEYLVAVVHAPDVVLHRRERNLDARAAGRLVDADDLEVAPEDLDVVADIRLDIFRPVRINHGLVAGLHRAP